MYQDLKPILNRLAESDEPAFREVFNRFSGRVYTFALKLTRSAVLSEEIVQDIFMKVWINRNTLNTIDYFPSYLYTLTRNHTLNILKRLAKEERVKATLIRDLSEIDNATEERVIFNEYQHILNSVIDRLPPQQRVVYGLCHQEGLRYEEVAQRLKISRLTVKTHMQQALRTIKTHFNHILSFFVIVHFILN
jgi:RNA polymerase sigma-70 factor (family 1)